MNIVFCVDKLSGGAGNVVQQLASYFSQSPDNAVTVTIIEDNGTKPKYDFSKVSIINRELSQTHLKNPFATVCRYFRQLKKTREIIIERKPDVVVSFLNSISPEILFALVGTGIPVLVSERSNPYQEWDANSLSVNFKWWLSYHLADKIIYQFDTFTDFFKFAKRKGRACTIPNMIFSPGTTAERVSSNKIRFCTFATLIPIKRQELMIEMFSAVHAGHPDTELNIYGSGPLEERLKCIAETSDGVNVRGPVANSYDELSKNDVFLLTSEREGFPNALLEALFSGLPGIAMRCHDGLSELLDGTDGFLVDDRESFIEAMNKIAETPSLLIPMGENARRKASGYLSDKILTLWETTINGCF